MSIRRNLLWVDGGGALLVGLLVVSLSGWLSEFYGLPRNILLFTGVVNLLYSSYSLTLAMKIRRPRNLITILVVANLSWVPICFVLAGLFWKDATVFGVGHLIGEGVYVACLACVEWYCREDLVR